VFAAGDGTLLTALVLSSVAHTAVVPDWLLWLGFGVDCRSGGEGALPIVFSRFGAAATVFWAARARPSCVLTAFVILFLPTARLPFARGGEAASPVPGGPTVACFVFLTPALFEPVFLATALSSFAVIAGSANPVLLIAVFFFSLVLHALPTPIPDGAAADFEHFPMLTEIPTLLSGLDASAGGGSDGPGFSSSPFRRPKLPLVEFQ
jgi:hypothetical protein